jgi:hypothetical protein
VSLTHVLVTQVILVIIGAYFIEVAPNTHYALVSLLVANIVSLLPHVVRLKKP